MAEEGISVVSRLRKPLSQPCSRKQISVVVSRASVCLVCLGSQIDKQRAQLDLLSSKGEEQLPGLRWKGHTPSWALTLVAPELKLPLFFLSPPKGEEEVLNKLGLRFHIRELECLHSGELEPLLPGRNRAAR